MRDVDFYTTLTSVFTVDDPKFVYVPLNVVGYLRFESDTVTTNYIVYIYGRRNKDPKVQSVGLSPVSYDHRISQPERENF